jgi:hypothetical protein
VEQLHRQETFLNFCTYVALADDFGGRGDIKYAWQPWRRPNGAAIKIKQPMKRVNITYSGYIYTTHCNL